jgi:uncharacterized integral membrane protein (TIGR00697 family)
MNEWLFLFHVIVVVGFALFSLRLGKKALIAFIALQGVLANLFVIKQMTLFGFSVTCSDVFAVGGILSLNLLQEYFGQKSAREASMISLLILVFFALMSQMHLLYVPASFDTTQGAFLTIFSPTFRIVAASITTLFLVQQVDVRLFPMFKGRLAVRVAFSLFCSQLLDTVLFSFLGLYGLVESVFSVISLSFLIKCIVIAVGSPFVSLSRKVMRLNLSQ